MEQNKKELLKQGFRAFLRITFFRFTAWAKYGWEESQMKDDYFLGKFADETEKGIFRI